MCQGNGPRTMCGEDISKLRRNKKATVKWCIDCRARRLYHLYSNQLDKHNWSDEPLFTNLLESLGLNFDEPKDNKTYAADRVKNSLKHDLCTKLKRWNFVEKSGSNHLIWRPHPQDELWGVGDPEAAIRNIKAFLTEAPGGFTTEEDTPKYQSLRAEVARSKNTATESAASATGRMEGPSRTTVATDMQATGPETLLPTRPKRAGTADVTRDRDYDGDDVDFNDARSMASSAQTGLSGCLTPIHASPYRGKDVCSPLRREYTYQQSPQQHQQSPQQYEQSPQQYPQSPQQYQQSPQRYQQPLQQHQQSPQQLRPSSGPHHPPTPQRHATDHYPRLTTTPRHSPQTPSPGRRGPPQHASRHNSPFSFAPPPHTQQADAALPGSPMLIIFGLDQQVAHLEPGRRAEAEQLQDEIARLMAERQRLVSEYWTNESRMLELGASLVDVVGTATEERRNPLEHVGEGYAGDYDEEETF